MLVNCLSKQRLKPALKNLFQACFLGIILLMEEDHFKGIAEKLNRERTLKAFLLRLFLLLQNMDKEEGEVSSNAIMKGLRQVSKILLIYFREEPRFDRQIWMSYFSLVVSFLLSVGNDEDKEECFSEKRRNIRQKMGFQLLSIWSHFGDQKRYFTPGLIRPLLKMTLIPEAEMRRSTLPIFFDLLDQEFRAKGNFKQVRLIVPFHGTYLRTLLSMQGS